MLFYFVLKTPWEQVLLSPFYKWSSGSSEVKPSAPCQTSGSSRLRRWSLSYQGLGFLTLLHCLLQRRDGSRSMKEARSVVIWSPGGETLKESSAVWDARNWERTERSVALDWVQRKGHRCWHSLVLGAVCCGNGWHDGFLIPPSQVVFSLNAYTLAYDTQREGKSNRL